MTVTELLTALGFVCLGLDPKQKTVTLWLRSGVPDILLRQTAEDTHVDDVARLLYEAGTRDKAEEIAARWRAFTDAMKFPDLSDAWTQARALQQQMQAEQIAQTSMPKN